MYDVAIAGGGPAGLNAALLLGRCRRRVLLCDAGAPRGAVSRGVNGFLSRDGIPPAELRRIAREQLVRYDGVEVRDVEAPGPISAGRACGDGGGRPPTRLPGIRPTPCGTPPPPGGRR